MLKLKKISLKSIVKKAKREKMIVFGAGRRLKKFINIYPGLSIENYIYAILDNSEEKRGTEIELRGKKFIISSPDSIYSYLNSKIFIFITPVDYYSIYEQLQHYFAHKNVDCCLFSGDLYRCEALFRKTLNYFPFKNYIFVRGEGDTWENASALADFILSNFNKYKVIWVVSHPENFKNKKGIFLKYNTLNMETPLFERLKYIYWNSISKWVIFENTNLEKQRPEQIYVYLKHGEMSLKNIKNVNVKMPPDINVIIAASEYSKNMLIDQYGIDNNLVFRCGAPRTDTLFSNYLDEDVFKLFNGRNYKKNILWVPTFRKSSSGIRNDSRREYNKGLPIINNDYDLEKIQETLSKNNIQIIIKPHKYQDLSVYHLEKMPNIRLLLQDDIEKKGFNTIQIMKYFDAMITDYSSISFDFLILDRPIAYTLDDLEDYKLGLIDNAYDFMPGPHLYNVDDFCNFITDVSNGEDKYSNFRKEVNEKVNTSVDGHSCERLCHILGIE